MGSSAGAVMQSHLLEEACRIGKQAYLKSDSTCSWYLSRIVLSNRRMISSSSDYSFFHDLTWDLCCHAYPRIYLWPTNRWQMSSRISSFLAWIIETCTRILIPWMPHEVVCSIKDGFWFYGKFIGLIGELSFFLIRVYSSPSSPLIVDLLFDVIACKMHVKNF